MKILKKNLGNLVPQRTATNASEDDLKGKFQVMDIEPRRDSGVDTDLTEERSNDDMGNMLVRLKSPQGRIFTLSLRQFFGLPEAGPTQSKEDVEGEMEGNQPKTGKLPPLYASLLENAGDDDDATIDIPSHIEFVYVAPRVNAEGKAVYAASAYPAFQERVAKMEAAHNKAVTKGKAKGPFQIMEVYQDRTFLRTLEGMAPDPTIPNLQPQKILVIKKA